MWITGVDGCKGGWLRVLQNRESGDLRFDVCESAAMLSEQVPHPSLLCIDIPIGLTETGGRSCDAAAREILGWPRRASVFPAPIRPALHARNRIEAAKRNEAVDGRKVGTQAWALYPKIREVDALLLGGSMDQGRFREVHPEVSFWAMAGGHPMEASKKTVQGRQRRTSLVQGQFGEDAFVRARAAVTKELVADDDILDAFAALWTACRVAKRMAVTLPADPPVDSKGLRMEIVY